MVDENLPRGEKTQPPAAEPGQPTAAPTGGAAASTAEPAAVPAPEREAAASLEAPAVAAEPRAETERERWLRDRFEREHEVILALTRLLLVGLSSESRAMRFWRWLIDDMRSERRITADLGASDEERMLVRRVLTWFRERRFDRRSRIPPQYEEPSGSSSGGELRSP